MKYVAVFWIFHLSPTPHWDIQKVNPVNSCQISGVIAWGGTGLLSDLKDGSTVETCATVDPPVLP